MRGIVYTGSGVEVTDALEVREPGPTEVKVRMQAAGVCHSDLSVIDGTIPFPAPAVLRIALDCLDWAGNAVAIGIPPRGTEVAVDVNALAYVDRGLLGCRYGSSRPHHDIPLMVDFYRSGQLMLDELVSLTRPLEKFGDVVDEMHAGRVARGVLTFD